MTPEEIIDKNKSIALFVGYKECGELIMHPEFGTLTKKGLKLLDYNTNWNQLMLVVEKIESIKDSYHGRFGVHICSNTCTIQSTNFRPDKRIPDPPHYFDSITFDDKRMATWLVVVRFIQWYSDTDILAYRNVNIL